MGDTVAASDVIPSELVNLRTIYERRFTRRKEALEEKQRELGKVLEPLIAAHRKAVHEYEDHFDDGLLKYGRDPNKMPFEDRDPGEVKIARKLKRAIEDAEALVRNKESELAVQLKGSPEFKGFKAAQEEFEDWLGKVCVHLRCCSDDLDWQARIANRNTVSSTVPDDLLTIPA